MHALDQARHDLRNPVSHILGFAEMLLEQQANKETNSFTNGVKLLGEHGRKMIDLINHYLNASNLLSGRCDLASFESELHREAHQILQLTEELQQNTLILDDTSRDDLLRIAGAARQVLELSPRVLAMLRAPGFLESLVPSPVPVAAEPRKPQSKPRVLLIDDLAELRQQLQSRLLTLGYIVVPHEDAPSALHYLSANTVDAILLDLSMPGQDGVETLKLLKSNPATQAIPVLMLTFAEPPEKLAHCLELGAAGVLPKPCSDLLLQARLKAILPLS